MTDDGREHRIIGHDFDTLSEALDALDELPDDQPGCVMNGPARAEWALSKLLWQCNMKISRPPENPDTRHFFLRVK